MPLALKAENINERGRLPVMNNEKIAVAPYLQNLSQRKGAENAEKKLFPFLLRPARHCEARAGRGQKEKRFRNFLMK